MNLGVLVTCPKGWMPSSVGVDDRISCTPKAGPAAAVEPSETSALAAGLPLICRRHSMLLQEANAWRLLVPPVQPCRQWDTHSAAPGTCTMKLQLHTTDHDVAHALTAVKVSEPRTFSEGVGASNMQYACSKAPQCVFHLHAVYLQRRNCAWTLINISQLPQGLEPQQSSAACQDSAVISPISITAAALGTATALWLARGTLMLLLPTARSCDGASLIQLSVLRSRQNVSAASLPDTLLEHSMPPCSSSWSPSTAVATAVRAEGTRPCGCSSIQLGVGLLREEHDRGEEAVLQDCVLLRSRQQICMCRRMCTDVLVSLGVLQYAVLGAMDSQHQWTAAYIKHAYTFFTVLRCDNLCLQACCGPQK
jgi:hypothetical protein